MRVKSIFFALCASAAILLSGCYKTGFGELSGGGDEGETDPRPRLYLADFNNLTAANEAKLASGTEWVILDSGAWDEQTEEFNITASEFDGLKTTLKVQNETIDLIFENIQCIPDGVFGDSSFNMIGKVELPKAIYVGRYSFSHTSITSVSMPSYTGDTYYGGDNGKYAFCDCSSLKSLSADNMEQVANYMFLRSGLVEVSLPKVEELNYMSFTECYYLESISLPSYRTSNTVSYQIHGPNLKYVELATAPGVMITEIGYDFFTDNTTRTSDLPDATLKIGSESNYIIDENNKRLYVSYYSEKKSDYYTFGTIEVVDNEVTE